jgi:magnesium transporter
MINTYTEEHFTWIDVLDPTPEELNTLHNAHNIHEAFIKDISEPEHLPKVESLGDLSFFIIRYYVAGKDERIDTIQGLTNKVAILQRGDLVITIHKHQADFIDELKTSLIDQKQCKGAFHLLNRLIKSVIRTYEAPAEWLAERIDFYESQTFLKQKPPSILDGLYHTKRKIEVSRKLLTVSREILEKIDDPAHQDPNTRDTRDLYVRMITLFETMSDNTNHLLTLYFSVSAQRTNEVIRVLTLFSVFFMPLTFVVGIYGMNFDFMPELRWKLGYPGVVGLMACITLVIYLWFRRRGWL